MTDALYWCELALVNGQVQDRVAITVRGGRFVSVDPGREPGQGATRLSGLTLPGMANAHSHAFHRALRGRTQVGGGSFWTWRDLMYGVAERLDPDSYHWLARATFAEMALAGVVAVGEFHYVHRQPGGSPYAEPNAMGEALLAAADEAGIRITLLDTLYLHGGLGADGYRPLDGVQRRFGDPSADAWAERVDSLSPSPDQRIGAAIHSVRAVDPASMEVAVAWADSRGAPLHAHVSEQVAENESCGAFHGDTPVGVLNAAGVLGARFVAVHATHVSDGDLLTLGTTGSSVCLCPTTERDLGDGIGPTASMAEAGVTMALGTDSHAVIDMFEESRAVELDERLRVQRRGIHPATELFAMASANGHASLGFDRAGVIAPGNRADLVAVSLDSVRTAGSDPALETAVFAAAAADVTDVVVDGRPVVAGGAHTLVDVAAELSASISEVIER